MRLRYYFTYKFNHVYVNSYVRKHTYTHTHRYIYICTHTYLCVYLYVYTQCAVRGVVCIWDVRCTHPGCAASHTLRASVAQKSLRASVKMAVLVARIGTQKDPCVHLFQKWPLYGHVSRVTKNQHMDPNIWNFCFYCRVLKTIGFHYSTLVYCLWGGIQSTRNNSSCNLNPGGVGGHGHLLI